MNKLDEVCDLEQIRMALAALDVKGTNKTISIAMTIVSVAKDCVRRGQPLDATLLLQHAQWEGKY